MMQIAEAMTMLGWNQVGLAMQDESWVRARRPTAQMQKAIDTKNCMSQAQMLKERLRSSLRCGFVQKSNGLILVDTIQRLGINYHFEEEITTLMNQWYRDEDVKHDLVSTSLRFRLLREQGYNESTDVFNRFIDSTGGFKEFISKDLKGLLSLHEASYLTTEGEEVLSQAMMFSKQHLQTLMHSLDPHVAKDIELALAIPIHRRMRRLEARSYIERYSKDCGKNADILEFAIMDYNMVQAQYQEEMAELIRWWKDLGLTEKLHFARDRPQECYLWAVGIFPDPGLSKCRIEIAKAVSILQVIDDIYDSYGSLDDLTLFTNALRSWDAKPLEKLPEYMKICYMALYNMINDTSFILLKEYGWWVVPQLRKLWEELCEGYLVEARWFSDGFVPTLEANLKTRIITGGTYMALVYASFLMGQPVTKEESFDGVGAYPKLFSSSGRILRLWDDLGTAKAEQERGDVASTIECYMNENKGSSEEDARAHVKYLIDSSWKDLYGELVKPTSALSRSIVNASLNLARTSQSVYQHGDDGEAPSVDDQFHTLLSKPIFAVRASQLPN